MKHMLLVAPLLLAACGGGELSLSITSDDLGDNSLALSTPADLTTVRALNITVDEIWVHIAGNDAPDEVMCNEVEDTSDGWHLLTSEDHTFDVMTVRGGAAWPLGTYPLPTGKLTQIRLKLKTDTTPDGERARLSGVVMEQDGTACDLNIPASTVTPGLKLSGALHALRVGSGSLHHAVMNLRIKDSTKLDSAMCAYKLDPVLKVKWANGGGDSN
ncbi:DUF4382 domain-containing protein [Pyxidicoccus parkwayensis]|uniref:DUF4382 domain-containing protein n=1 Tax=Pyxidicoccus parkwayensis TaxID=2813578 RepID=A0ABX7NTE6_9BACT|nr:DUF4382 domain-containing protein [Pyxidicoccus parkwaysis]QSQ20671.1 DUF4382 domain-containing protein [Pyxidicoccus parkwaysis]